MNIKDSKKEKQKVHAQFVEVETSCKHGKITISAYEAMSYFILKNSPLCKICEKA